MADGTANDGKAARPVPWRGRPRVTDPKGWFFAVRCTSAEHATLMAAAAQAGLSLGAYVRRVALGATGPRAVRRPPVERAELAQLLGQIGKVGSNVNQLAHAMHCGELITSADLEAAVNDVAAMRAAVMKALGRGD